MRSIMYLGLALVILAEGCDHSVRTDEKVTDTSAAATAGKPGAQASAKQGEQVLAQQSEQSPTLGKDEINQFSGMDTSSMVVKYNGVRSSVTGYVDKETSDTFHIEGDILMIRPSAGEKSVGTTNQLWEKVKDSIDVPYVFNAAYKDTDRIKEAFGLWRSKVKVRFKRKRSTDPDYVEFVPSQYTQSYVGRTGGGQRVELAYWATAGNIAHEIGHSLGLYHELARKDRDAWIKVNCMDAVNYGKAFLTDPYAIDLGAYDYFSIMHYSPGGCLEVLRPDVLKKLNAPADVPGQRRFVSDGDAYGIKKIYDLK